MAHLAAGARLALAVEMQPRERRLEVVPGGGLGVDEARTRAWLQDRCGQTLDEAGERELSGVRGRESGKYLIANLPGVTDREAVEAVTLEIAQLDRVSADEQQAVLGEFLDLGRRRLRFEFDNLAALGGQDVRSAYHDEDASTWAMALVGAPRPIRDHVLSALPASQATSLRRVIEGIGPFRLDDSEAAQNDLIERIRLLHDHGRLTLPDPSGQEEILA